MLMQEYLKGYRKGLITQTFPEWRKLVIYRINQLFGTEYEEMTDEEIMKYIGEKDDIKSINDVLKIVTDDEEGSDESQDCQIINFER